MTEKMARAYNLRENRRRLLEISNGKIKRKEPSDNRRNDHVLDYGVVTPKNKTTNADKLPLVKPSKVVLTRLEVKQDSVKNQSDKIADIQPQIHKTANGSRKFQIIFLLIAAVFFFAVYRTFGFDLLRKNLKPYELIVAPVKKLSKVESKSEKQEIKQTLFIEQECTKFQSNDLQYDYASESNGARILSTFNTEPYSEKLINFKFLGLSLGPLPNFLFQNFFESNGPTALLERFTKIKNCWTFKGTSGRVQIAFPRPIFIKRIILEDHSALWTETSASNFAVRFFSIAGIDYLENGQEIKNHLGSYEFEKNGGPVQIFPVISDEAAFSYGIIEFQVTANHGNNDFTCVYRLKVYGNPSNF